jgi:hypothetical protein
MRHLLNHARDAGKHRKYEMANELALIKNETALTHLAAVAAQAQEMRLLKFSKGNWLIGDDELLIACSLPTCINLRTAG